jgi:RNA polymerase subunit RPABC4/transcription elongation factor Spt4
MNSLTDVVSGNLAKALEEADKLLRSPRTRVEIITLNRQMKTVTSELGKRTLELYREKRVQDPELAELCARIISIEARIAEREARLAAQQAQSGSKAAEAAAATVRCPRCNTDLPEDAVFCQKCGLKMETSSPSPVSVGAFCAHCGRELRSEAKFCPRCGSPA